MSEEVDLTIDVTQIPTRCEKLGYTEVTTLEERKRRVPQWAREVQCPKCGTIMTPLKSKLDTRYGNNVTYQCWRINEDKRPCLVVVQVTDGTQFLMRPGDFSASDWNWKDVAEECVPVPPGYTIAGVVAQERFYKPHVVPPCPWMKGRVQTKVIWEQFWKRIMDTGECDQNELIAAVQEIRPQDRAGSFLYKLYRDVGSLPTWMQKKTGYVVKDDGTTFRVVGKGKGDMTEYPYNVTSYRGEHGLESPW